ncbi:unnamed protein product, partial [Staurois parvus]
INGTCHFGLCALRAIVVRDLCTRSQSCDQSLIGQSVITGRVVSKMSLLTSLLTTCEICE